mgnify:CR=1 FL=1
MISNNLKISFEFFPPKTRAMTLSLWKAIERLAVLNPHFVSVTYGAGGTTREKTHLTIKKILQKTNLTPVPHLTCIGSSKSEIAKIAKQYLKLGIKHIVALRGDLPAGYIHPKDGYDFAWQLVAGLKKIADFEISVAGYPEKHPEARTIEDDIDNLKRKIDNGATRIITQFFFDNNKLYDYINLLEKKQIKTPVVPGILPIVNFTQTVKFAKTCNTTIPTYLYDIFDDTIISANTKQILAAHIAIQQCQNLMEYGIKEFHFYTLNRAELILAICHILDIKVQY